MMEPLQWALYLCWHWLQSEKRSQCLAWHFIPNLTYMKHIYSSIFVAAVTLFKHKQQLSLYKISMIYFISMHCWQYIIQRSICNIIIATLLYLYTIQCYIIFETHDVDYLREMRWRNPLRYSTTTTTPIE